ncbi:MAG: YciI family protein [Ktedonobacterales bacterium]
MKYMLIFYGSQVAWDALTADDVDQLAKAHAEIKSELAQTGEMVAACELEVEGAQVVNSNRATIAVTDGPFSEGQQVITGYYIIDCIDTARATKIASKFAELKFAPIEVRRLGKGSSWTELQLQR